MDGTDDSERQLVWMLNAALRQDVASDCDFHRKRQMLYPPGRLGRRPMPSEAACQGGDTRPGEGVADWETRVT